MKRKLNVVSLLLFSILVVTFMDIIFRFATSENPISMDIFTSFVLLTTIVFFLFLIISFFQGTVQYVLVSCLFAFFSIIYSSQLVYYKAFHVYYSVYSVLNGNQIMGFLREIFTYIGQNFFWLLLLFLPTLLFIIFGKRLFGFEKVSWKKRAIILCLLLITYVEGLLILNLGGKEEHSAYDLYHKSHFPLLSVERLGLITTMRLDIQRTLFGTSSHAEAPPEIILPEPLPEDDEVEEEEPVEGDHEEQPEEEVEKPIEYNVMDIDFDQLIAEETDEEVINMHKYFQSVEPTKKNDYTGKYEGYNLVLFTAEGFAPYAVHPEITPTLYKLVNEGYQFTEFYTPIWEVSTSDGEYVALQGLIPKSGLWSFKESGIKKNYLPFVLGNQLKKLGYTTKAYHNHTYTYYDRHISHPNLGYDYKGVGNGLEVRKTWPESDLEMLEVTIDEYINNEPFHAYYMTVSGHLLYNFTGNYIAYKNRDLVKDLPLSEQAQAYLATQIELDRALEHLLNRLEEAGIADRTLIALSADHYPYGLEDETVSEFLGHPVEKNFELYKNTFILYTKGMEPEVIDKPASSLDILPTISNLMGLEYDSRLLMGRDIFSDSDPLVVFLNRSWITDKGKYNAATKEFTPFTEEEVTQEYIDYINSVVRAKFYYSTKILEKDYYAKVFKP